MTGAGGLQLERLGKRYGHIVAVNELTFDVRPGEVFGFVGSNGAGKTTTMRIVLGVLLADSGRVLWDGKPIDFATRRRVGYMPEERGLYPKMRVGEQLSYLAQLHGSPAAEADKATRRWLNRFGLADRIGDEVQKLSHGNQQRVQLAAALVFEPLMLILDEPFAGLDPEAVDSMSEVLHERAATGTPVLFSSHQLDLVERLCDRVGIIQWTGGLTGVRVVRTDGSRVLLELDPSTDDQSVLRAALATGPVREFRRNVPSLLDIFRHAMTEAPVAATA